VGWDCLAYKSNWLRDHFLLVARSDHTTGNRNIKPDVVFKVQKMAQYALFRLIMGLFKGGGVPVLAKLWPVRVSVRVSFTTGAARSAILATAGLLVCYIVVASNFYSIQAQCGSSRCSCPIAYGSVIPFQFAFLLWVFRNSETIVVDGSVEGDGCGISM